MPNESLIAAPSARINARTDIARTAARCRAVMRLSTDGVRFRSASEPVRASLVFFHASLGSEIDNVVTAALLPPQPDQLRCRHDNGERATPLYYRTGDRSRYPALPCPAPPYLGERWSASA